MPICYSSAKRRFRFVTVHQIEDGTCTSRNLFVTGWEDLGGGPKFRDKQDIGDPCDFCCSVDHTFLFWFQPMSDQGWNSIHGGPVTVLEEEEGEQVGFPRGYSVLV